MNKEKICPHTEKCFVLWRNRLNKENASIIIPSDEKDRISYNKFKKDLLDIFKVVIDSEETIHFRIEELEPIFSKQVEKEIKKICSHVEKCFFFWREEPKGKGESAVIIVPLDGLALDSTSIIRDF